MLVTSSATPGTTGTQFLVARIQLTRGEANRAISFCSGRGVPRRAGAPPALPKALDGYVEQSVRVSATGLINLQRNPLSVPKRLCL